MESKIEISLEQLSEPSKSIGTYLIEFYKLMQLASKYQNPASKQSEAVTISIDKINSLYKSQT